AAIAAKRSKHISGKALGMDSDQRRGFRSRGSVELAANQSDGLFLGPGAFESKDSKPAVARRQVGMSYHFDRGGHGRNSIASEPDVEDSPRLRRTERCGRTGKPTNRRLEPPPASPERDTTGTSVDPVNAKAHKLIDREIVHAAGLHLLDEFGRHAMDAHGHELLRFRVLVAEAGELGDKLGRNAMNSKGDKLLQCHMVVAFLP